MTLPAKFVAQPDTSAYDAQCVPDAQPRAADIDPVFVDAMRVRHAVFVLEQNVPADAEFDDDDARCCHWVTYSRETGQPTGTLRLVPYPQGPHPTPGADYTLSGGTVRVKGRYVVVADPARPPDYRMPLADLAFEPLPATAPQPVDVPDRATTLHDGTEPYVKLGRIAVVKAARGTGLGLELVQTALAWLQANPSFFDKVGASGFKGLVCLHAQTHAIGFYQKLGFEVDAGMGTWWEEGIPHVGMFRRLNMA